MQTAAESQGKDTDGAERGREGDERGEGDMVAESNGEKRRRKSDEKQII